MKKFKNSGMRGIFLPLTVNRKKKMYKNTNKCDCKMYYFKYIFRLIKLKFMVHLSHASDVIMKRSNGSHWKRGLISNILLKKYQKN